MAWLNSPPEKYGTFGNICVYPMYGKACMRTASSLTGERVKEDPAFKNTMASAKRLTDASRLAAAVYAMLPPSRQKHRLYRRLTGQAIKLVKERHTEGGVVVELMITIQLPRRKPRKKPVKQPVQQLQQGQNEKQTIATAPPVSRRIATVLLMPFPSPQRRNIHTLLAATRQEYYHSIERIEDG